MTRPVCDIVVTTRNRPDPLRRMLRALLHQTHRDFGVIVVDDCSDTPIAAVVEAAEFDALRRQVVRLARPSGPAAGRNAGVAASEATYIIFLDDDVVAAPRFVELHLHAVQNAGTDAEAGPVVSCGPFVQPADWDHPTVWNLWEARQAKKEHDNLVNGVYAATWRQFHTGNNCLPADVFRAVGGFNETFKRSEDDELALRLHHYGCRFVFVPEAVGLHYSRRSLEAWLLTPRAYAYFDTMIDRSAPNEGYLAAKKRELRRRHPIIRAARATLRGTSGRRFGVAVAVRMAKMAHAVRATPIAMVCLSVAYDLSYVQSLDDTARGESEFDQAVAT